MQHVRSAKWRQLAASDMMQEVAGVVLSIERACTHRVRVSAGVRNREPAFLHVSTTNAHRPFPAPSAPSPRSTSRRKAAPNGVISTVRRLHKRQQLTKALMIHDKLAKEGGTPAQTLPPPHPPADDPLRFELREHVRKLRLILPVISVSVMALHHQNAELDYDIATILNEYASGPLDEEIEHLALMLEGFASRSRQQEVRV
jgi:hypothetical protein